MAGAKAHHAAPGPRYKAGDEVLIDGMKWTLRSWPQDDQGHFTATRINKDGGEVWTTLHTGAIVEAGEPVYSSADVELVRAAEHSPESTLPAVELAAVNTEIAAEAATAVGE
jgi:hypothetical protein